MTLRKSLLPTTDPERIALIQSKIEEIEEALDDLDRALFLVEAFNTFTGHQYRIDYFENYWRSESIEEFARTAAQNPVEQWEDIREEEFVDLVERIRNDGNYTDYYLALLEANVPHPQVSDLIFWPQSLGFPEKLSAEEIVKEALAFRTAG